MRGVILALACFVVPSVVPSAHASDAVPYVAYWHLWTGNDGKSHLTKCAMTAFARQGTTNQLQVRQPGTATIVFAYNPKGDWHENLKVQWVVPLQGAFFIEAQDGTTVTLAPGNLYLGEDLNTIPDAAGHKGHLSASKGDEPLVLMISQLDAAPTVGRPCHLK